MTIPAEVLAAVKAVVGEKWVLSGRVDLETYSSDGLPTHHSRPGAVVLPGTNDEVVRVLKILSAHGIPFVARGAGTGLSGGALAAEDAVLLTLTRLDRILQIDPVNRCAVVEPGVVNVQLTAAAQQYGLHYAPDPASQAVCTIGGNVAENAGGPHCLKYGVTTDHVLSLEVVLPSGEVVDLGAPGGELWGPDLVSLFVGSEGAFGVATRITVRLTPNPTTVRTVLAVFPSMRAAGQAVTDVIASGIVPAALEMMDRNCIAAVEASSYSAGYPKDAEAVLILEIDGLEEAPVIADTRSVEALLREAGATDVRVGADPAQRTRLWQGRKKAFGAMGRISPDLMVQDAVVPRSALPDILEQVAAIARKYELSICNVFHAGDGNLHPNINLDKRDQALVHRVAQASAEIMRACISAGGTITGEHGVGVEKLHFMPLVFNAATLQAFRDVRRAFDPLERANPGKVVPEELAMTTAVQSRD
jgi:glycolate oxidase subunit GlcD